MTREKNNRFLKFVRDKSRDMANAERSLHNTGYIVGCQRVERMVLEEPISLSYETIANYISWAMRIYEESPSEFEEGVLSAYRDCRGFLHGNRFGN